VLPAGSIILPSPLAYHGGMTTSLPPPKYCRACDQFKPSQLAGHGYCLAAPSLDLRARLLRDGSVCLFQTEWCVL